MKDISPEQLFTSSQVLKRVDITYRQLSYWELKGIIKPSFQRQGTRDFKRYTQEDINTLKTIKKLLNEGYSLPTTDTLNEIAKRKEAEEILKQYQFMVESAHDAIFFKDLKSRYIIANKKTLEAFGLPREQVVGKNDYEIMPSKVEAKKNIENDQIVFKTGKSREFTKHMTGVDGKERWFEAIKVPQFDNKGNIIGLVGIARDITKRKEVEKKLRESRSFIERIADAAPEMMIYLYDLIEQRNVYVSRQIGGILGYSREEIEKMGSRIIEILVHPDDLESVNEHMRKVSLDRKDEVIKNEYRMKHANGKWRWLLSRDAVFARNSDGSPRQNIGIAVDITDHKETEEKLRDSESKMHTILDAMPDMIFQIGKDGTFLDFKPSKIEDPAVSPSEFIGKNIYEVMPIESAQKAMQYIEQALLTGKMQVFEYQLPVPLNSNNMRNYEAQFIANGKDNVIAVVRTLIDKHK